MKEILLVGDHPAGYSGNSHMMSGIIKSISKDAEVHVFAVTTAPKPFDPKQFPYIVEGGLIPTDVYGANQLVERLKNYRYDLILFVGLDVWVYGEYLNYIRDLRDRQNFVWASIFPYDMHTVRKDLVGIINWIDFPCVYSEYGFNTLKPHVPKIRYFRPPLFESEKFITYDPITKAKAKKDMFSKLDDDAFVFGFFGNNQYRKDPQRIIKAFFLLKEKHPNAVLYLHTELEKGVYNLKQYIEDCGGKSGDVMVKKQGLSYNADQMTKAYNACDAYVSASLQEGLNWTILEAMLCGVPVIASYNTAHMELIQMAGHCVPCTDIAYVPILTNQGPSFVESKACDLTELVFGMSQVMDDSEYREELIRAGKARAKDWLSKVSSTDDLLSEIISYRNSTMTQKEVRNAVLFAQHSSAGDVLMTTRCLKGLRERYGDIPIDYMTSPQYMDILENNPLINNIIAWDERLLKEYRYVVNPHGERIAPGHWGRNSNSLLADFYWKILRVEPNEAMIELKCPECLSQEMINDLTDKPFVVVHTTGGDSIFRTYEYMGEVCKRIKEEFPHFMTVQLGGKDDYPAGADVDLRGKLSFRESAWIMDEATYAITVDSFISHLAGFLAVPQVCLFGSGNHNVVKPVGTVICMVPDYINYCKGLGPCSASVRNCPVKCTGIHDPEDVFKQFKKLKEGGE